MKKSLTMVSALGMAVVSLVGYGSGTSEAAAPDTMTAQTTIAGATAADTTMVQAEASAAGAKGPITVASREDDSGTRGMFIELFGVEVKNDVGEKKDMTTEDAETTNSTSVMMTIVAGNMEAVGYISLGSLNDTTKAVKTDGVEAMVDNIKSSSYKITRSFNIATKEDMSEVIAGFIKYMMSKEGQKVVEDNGYISQGNEGVYEAAGVFGKIVVIGSSSVAPVMEKLKEAYVALNPDVTIETQQSDPTTSVISVIEGVCDIGMASRELKDTELEKDIKGTAIVTDGVAVTVNNDNPIEELSSETVKGIYTGETIDWVDAQQFIGVTYG